MEPRTEYHTTTTGSYDHRWHLQHGWQESGAQVLRHIGLTSLHRDTCPACGSVLQKLEGQDGWGVELTVDDVTRRRVVEGRAQAVVRACPGCEHCE